MRMAPAWQPSTGAMGMLGVLSIRLAGGPNAHDRGSGGDMGHWTRAELEAAHEHYQQVAAAAAASGEWGQWADLKDRLD